MALTFRNVRCEVQDLVIEADFELPGGIVVGITGAEPGELQLLIELAAGSISPDEGEIERTSFFLAAPTFHSADIEAIEYWVDAALESAHRLFRFGPTGWKIQAELPNVRNFEAATAFVRREDMADAFGAGPDVETHVATVKGFADVGYDRLALISAGPDVEEFFAFYEGELAGRLRAL